MTQSLKASMSAPADKRTMVGIPTYKRPAKLKALLESLAPSLRDFDAEVVVADNACSAESEAVVEAFRAIWPKTVYIPVPERGISAVRNALIAAFETRDVAWLAMVDDDLTVKPDWLARMTEAGVAYDGDVVGGPYACKPEQGISFIVANSIFVQRPRRATGLCPPIGGTGNTLVKRSLLDKISAPHFQNRYGLSGGEDYDFFRRAAKAGAKFVWADEADAVEDVELDRLTPGAVLRRYYSTGNYMALIDREHDGLGSALALHASNFLKALIGLGVSALRFSKVRILTSLFRLCFATGAMSSFLGRRIYRYG